MNPGVLIWSVFMGIDFTYMGEKVFEELRSGYGEFKKDRSQVSFFLSFPLLLFF